jgi:hypothetical protein
VKYLETKFVFFIFRPFVPLLLLYNCCMCLTNIYFSISSSQKCHIPIYSHEGGMEEELVGQIFEAMMIPASGEVYISFSATRCGRVAKYVKIWAFAGFYRYGLARV